jgi:hypothetical protein
MPWVQSGDRSAGAVPAPQVPRGGLFRAGRKLRKSVRGLHDLVEIRADGSYRRLAEGYELPDGSRRVYCHHVRKTAGTSLHLSFMALGGEDPWEVYRRMADSRLYRTRSGDYGYVAFHRRLLAEGAYFYGRSHNAAAGQELPPRTFTVTVLRDPVERAHSYFDYLVAGDDPGMPGRPVGNRERRVAVGGFDKFLEGVAPGHLMAQLGMFSERFDVSEATDRIASCSSVFFTENFAEGLGELAGRLELPLEVHRARVTGQRSTLSDRQRERLRSRLEPEYELLRRLSEGGVASMRSTQPGR